MQETDSSHPGSGKDQVDAREEVPDESIEAQHDPERHYCGPVSADLHTSGGDGLRGEYDDRYHGDGKEL